MSRKLYVNDDGMLEDEAGRTLGRLVSLVVDDSVVESDASERVPESTEQGSDSESETIREEHSRMGGYGGQDTVEVQLTMGGTTDVGTRVVDVGVAGTSGTSSDSEAFETWLAHHQSVTSMRPPGERTKVRRDIKAMFDARIAEGYTLEQLCLASLGAYTDEYRRSHRYYDHISILRPTKVHALAEKGRLVQQGEVVRTKSNGRVTMADREAAVRRGSSAATQRQDELASLGAALVAPETEPDPFTGALPMSPEQQQRRARARLKEMGATELDALASFEQRRATLEHQRGLWARPRQREGAA